jgi:hypothetical protein
MHDWMGHRMIGSDDCIELAQRCAQLAVACSSPSLSEALMKLAGDYLAQSHKHSAGELKLHQQPDPLGFGD